MSSVQQQHNRYGLVLAVAGSGIFLSTLDSGVINVALPFLRQSFHTSVNKISWTISGYFLALSATIVLFGKLGDRFGRVNVFATGLWIFAIGSLLCGLSTSANQLIAWRVIQALGAAAMQGSATGIITTLIMPQYRNRALGMFSLILGMGPIIGPTFAGAMIAFFSWHWIFFINIPICLCAFIGTRLLHDTGSYQRTRLDFIGMLLFATMIFLFVLGLTLGGHPSGRGLVISGLMLATLISLLAFIYCEKRVSSPLLNLQLFKNFIFSSALFSMMTLGFTMSAILMIPPLELHLIRHLSAGHIGLISLSAPLGLVILSRIAGKRIDCWGEQRLMLTGLTIMLIALLLLASRTPNWGILSLPPLLFIYGIGAGLFMPANISQIMKSGSAEHQGTMGAINRMVLNLGNAIGVAAAALIIGLHAKQNIDHHIATSLRQPWILSSVMMALALAFSFLQRIVGRRNAP